MTKAYQAKLIRLAKEIEEIQKAREYPMYYIGTDQSLLKLGSPANLQEKLNYLLGFILGGEDD